MNVIRPLSMRVTSKLLPASANLVAKHFAVGKHPPSGALSASEAAEEKHARKTSRLKEELRRGYFHELAEVNRTHGKLFEADRKILPTSSARVVPDIQAESLLDFGFQQLRSWVRPFQCDLGRLPGFSVLQVNFEDKTWLKLFKSMIIKGQKAEIEQERHAQSFVHFGSNWDIREAMGLDNRMVGYAFLVDDQGRIRWRATGEASAEETLIMLRLATAIRKEQQRQGR